MIRRLGTGPRQILALHCALGHSGTFKPLATALPDCTLTAPDMPGHGRGPTPDPAHDFQTQALETAEQAAPTAPFDLIGHSFGGTVALRYALAHPGDVRSLTLIEPVMFAAAKGTPAFTDHMAEMQPFDAAIAASDHTRAADLFTRIWGDGQPFQTVPAATQSALARMIPLIPAGAPSIVDDIHQIMPQLPTLRTPTLILTRADPPAIVAAITQGLTTQLPNATAQTIPGAGHMIPITHPEQTAAAIRTLLWL